jgi:hypothetical protein
MEDSEIKKLGRERGKRRRGEDGEKGREGGPFNEFDDIWEAERKGELEGNGLSNVQGGVWNC